MKENDPDSNSHCGIRGRTLQAYQNALDKVTPYVKLRWTSVVFLIILFYLRVLLLQGWYIVAYTLGIYHLNLFIGFLTPQTDPALEALFPDDDGPVLPRSTNDEFRPFIRRLPEFKFWHSVAVSTIIAVVCTFVDSLNFPVYWPILLGYFILLFFLTMKQRINHMIRYRYLPFTHGKPRYRKRRQAASDIIAT